MSSSSFKNFLKHKRIIIFSLLLIGALLMIVLMYVLTYTNNKPVIFKNKNAEILKPDEVEMFDVNVNVIELKYKEGNSNGTMKYSIEFTNLKEDLKNVSVVTELNSNWTDTLTEGSTYKVNDGNTLSKKKESYSVSNASSTLKNDYPIKVLPFVKVKSPNIYLKITYTKVAPAILSDAEKTETIYVVFTWDDYFTSTSKYA